MRQAAPPTKPMHEVLHTYAGVLRSGGGDWLRVMVQDASCSQPLDFALLEPNLRSMVFNQWVLKSVVLYYPSYRGPLSFSSHESPADSHERDRERGRRTLGI